MVSRHIEFSYTESYFYTDIAVKEFYDGNNELIDYFWEDTCDELIISMYKPQKWTVLHIWIEYLVDSYLDYLDRKLNNETLFDIKNKILLDAGYNIRNNHSKFVVPSFININNCSNCGTCIDCSIYNLWKNYYNANWDNAKKNLIHTTFNILMYNKKFLRDFNIYLADCLKNESNKLSTSSKKKTKKGKIPRVNYWPAWLKEALKYRDKGCCTICRKDITQQWNLNNKINLDHIVPISNYGNNDPSNIQVLCRACNSIKGNRNYNTSGLDVPLWNV